ncbi:MAG: dihydrofolate reductase family protein [Actinomycetota bacterium]
MANRVAANLVLGADGSTILNGSSAGLSFPADRRRFHELRQEFDALLIGGNTARNEPYEKTPLPLIVLSHGELPPKIAANPVAVLWNLSIGEAISKATREYGDLLIEAGPALLRAALATEQVTELFLTISARSGGENIVNSTEFTHGAIEISREEAVGGLLLRYRLAPSHH